MRESELIRLESLNKEEIFRVLKSIMSHLASVETMEAVYDELKGLTYNGSTGVTSLNKKIYARHPRMRNSDLSDSEWWTIHFARIIGNESFAKEKDIRESINNGNIITIYHGDDFNTEKIDVSLMFNGNNQEGVGIYFGSRKVAEDYGSNIISAEVDSSRFIASRKSMADEIGETEDECEDKIYRMLHHLHQKDIHNEDFFYCVTDYGYVIGEIDEVDDVSLHFLSEKLIREEVRNFQITLAEIFGVERFVEAWKAVLPDIVGTYAEETGFYAILDDKIAVSKVGLDEDKKMADKIAETKARVRSKSSSKKLRTSIAP